MPDVIDVIKGMEEVKHFIKCENLPAHSLKALLTIDDALALLKAREPCEDAVSRKDVINVLQSPCDMRYVNGNWHPCIGDYIEAITNLSAVAPKAQEPKVISLRDVVCADVGNVVWLETNYDGKTGIEPFLVCIDFTQKPMIINGWDSFYNISEQELNDGIVNSFDDEFTVRKFRFWSSKPTDEQRGAVKWE